MTDIALYDLLMRMDEGYVPDENEMSEIDNRKILDISGSDNTNIPNSICKLKNLQHLCLSYTYISELPDCVGELSNLQSLRINSTFIKSLPESIGKLSSLTWLDLRDTLLRNFPNSFSNLTSLKILSLGGTYISFLPDSIKNFTALESLGLSNSSITSLPSWIGNLPKLRHLNMMYLTLPTIPKSLALKNLPFIETSYFELGDNGINVWQVTLTEQPLSVFTETPELIPTLYGIEPEVTVRESKVIFLGDGGTGKTYTIKRFMNDGKHETEQNPYLTSETPGVEIVDYPVSRGEDSFNIHFGTSAVRKSYTQCTAAY